jgi:hypothetical protein
VEKSRNDTNAAVPKFCLALEKHRRTPDGRVRSPEEFVKTFFSHDERSSNDRLFRHLPRDIRGPILAAWGIRGAKAALRDTDEKVQEVVHDALVAGDIDPAIFEEGISPDVLVKWMPLADLWSFWRGGKLGKAAILQALSTAYELYLFDAKWFLETIQGKSPDMKGTDVLADGLTKEELTAWVRRIHETGDGSPKGLVAALGWEKIVQKSANDVLVAVLDAMVARVGLVVAPRADTPSTRSLEASAKASIPPPAASAVANQDVPTVAPEAAAEKSEGWSEPPQNRPSEMPTQSGQLSAPSPEDLLDVLVDEDLASSTALASQDEVSEVQHVAPKAVRGSVGSSKTR